MTKGDAQRAGKTLARAALGLAIEVEEARFVIALEQWIGIKFQVDGDFGLARNCAVVVGELKRLLNFGLQPDPATVSVVVEESRRLCSVEGAVFIM